jgi:hypothetical protein
LPEKEEKFISGIHNYCDRWCERCPFTARCSVAESENELTDDRRDIKNEAFWRNLHYVFAEAKQMILERAEELGVESEPISDEEFAAHRTREDEIIETEDLTRLAEKYRKTARKTLEEKNDWLIFSAADEETQEEMLEIISWYQFFIAAKIHRGLSGILDFDGNTDEAELNDSQSDANGSIKIALIAVMRSMMAWTALMTKENSAHIKPLLNLLETIKQKTEEKFPHAAEFIRPGFDEVETVM